MFSVKIVTFVAVVKLPNVFSVVFFWARLSGINLRIVQVIQGPDVT